MPQSGTTLGNPGAKLVVVEFADPQCPFCALVSATPSRRSGRAAGLAVSLAGAVFSLYLLALQLVVIDAVCV